MTLRSKKTAALLAALAAATGLLVAAEAAIAAAPLNVTPPTISGTARVGRTLTATNGTWDNVPTSFRYRWQRCNLQGASCVTITGATGITYGPVAADVDHTIRVIVTAVNADGATDAQSRQTPVVSANARPRNVVRPTISGTPRVGEELTATTGAWTGGVRSFAFSWQRCDAAGAGCAAVAGANGRTYGVRSADAGHTLRVAVTARNLAGATTVESDRTAVVQSGTTPPPASNKRPTLRVLSIRFVGARVFVRFRVCDDSGRNVRIIVRESRRRVASMTRSFATRTAPNPCGVYSRSWTPAARFRSPSGRYLVTLWARDVSGLLSSPVRRTFIR
jgi:hypothetical protein